MSMFCDFNDVTPLHLASQTPEYHAIPLFELGSYVTMKTRHKRTVLHYAAIGRKSSVIKILLDKMAATNDSANLINAKDRFRRTALMDAARAGMWDACSWLLGAGADPSPTDELGRNAPHWC
jgi:ankyrin repeat protein